MSKLQFRKLNASEVEVRIGGFNKAKTGMYLLIYKDARVDMKILDETFGVFGWERDHKELNGNIYCGIGIYDIKTNRTVWKWDAGSEIENNTSKDSPQKVKGSASDSFKRAGFNWGIGRELYTSPFIWLNQGVGFKDKWDKFSVKEIDCDSEGVINKLVIYNETLGKVVYTLDKKETPKEPVPFKKATQEQIKELTELIPDLALMFAHYQIDGFEQMSEVLASETIRRKKGEKHEIKRK